MRFMIVTIVAKKMSDKSEELLNSGSAYPSSENANLSPETEGQRDVDDKAHQEELWKSELFRLENEISTLRSVLSVKIKEAEDLKRKLGITPLVEFKEDLKQGFQSIKGSEPVQKTSAAFKDFGEYASKKLEDIRHSNAFKSVEEKVGGAYSSVKKRISAAPSDGSPDEPTSPSSKETPPAAGDAESGQPTEGYLPL